MDLIKSYGLTEEVYYAVGNERYRSKLSALERATQLKADVHWKFHNSVFDNVSWNEQPLDLNLHGLYQKRAKQLREKYDYLILAYSGGSDSWTALRAFLSQGIYPDELLVTIPKKVIDKVNPKPDWTDRSPENVYAEWTFQMVPSLEWVRTHFPNVKITIRDFAEDFDQEFTEQKWHEINDFYNYKNMMKFDIPVFGTHAQMIDLGKKVGIIYGQDKPQLMFKDGKYYFYFLDKLTGIASHKPGRTVERFYWSPDCVDILRAQSWLVYQHFKMNPHQQDLVLVPRKQWADKDVYDDLVRSIVYEQWWNENKRCNFFYAKKNKHLLYNETANICSIVAQTSVLYQSWESQLKSVFSVIDPKFYYYVDGQMDGFSGFISNNYYLGDA